MDHKTENTTKDSTLNGVKLLYFFVIASVLLAVITTALLLKTQLELAYAIGHMKTFEVIVSRVDSGELNKNEAVYYIKNYYPAGTILNEKSQASRCVEIARNLAIRKIDCTTANRTDHSNSDGSLRKELDFFLENIQ